MFVQVMKKKIYVIAHPKLKRVKGKVSDDTILLGVYPYI